MTRSMGDLVFKHPTALCTAEPDIHVSQIPLVTLSFQILPLTDKDLFLVLCSDGIFEKLTNDAVTATVIDHWMDGPVEAAKSVVRSAHDAGAEDNLTCMVIFFGWMDDSDALSNMIKYISET
jgi:serine/threonine protein phosphatase PrpC